MDGLGEENKLSGGDAHCSSVLEGNTLGVLDSSVKIDLGRGE